jgi:RND family efflux transporter MFP subunit
MADTVTSGAARARGWRRKWWLLSPVVAAAVVTACVLTRGPSPTRAAAQGEERSAADGAVRLGVDVVKPRRGVLERVTTQPGNAIAFRCVEVIPEVAGYIDKQPVDIGTPVKKGDLLVEIRVPDLRTLLEKQEANFYLAQSQVEEAQAAWGTARADLKATLEKITEAQAKLRAAQASLKFRDKQRKRYQGLLATGSIDARLVDEQEDRYEAAREAAISCDAVLRSTRAQKDAAQARVDQAKASLGAAKRKVGVAKGDWDYAKSMVAFATIRAPFDGKVTRRTFFPGDFVHAATGAKATSLLRVEQTDKVRVVVYVPDCDVPYCDAGAKATVVFDNIPNRPYEAAVSRVSGSEDALSKTMRVEIDLDNKDGRIRQGMFARATIVLSKVPDALTIPSSSLVVGDEGARSKGKKGPSAGGAKKVGARARVFVVEDGQARLRDVRTGINTGREIEVLQGLTDADLVVASPRGLEDGSAVEVRAGGNAARP